LVKPKFHDKHDVCASRDVLCRACCDVLDGRPRSSGLSKNRRDDDGTGRSIPPAAGGYIVALMTRRGGWRVDGTAWQVTMGQVTCSPTQINESTIPWTWRRSRPRPKCRYWA